MASGRLRNFSLVVSGWLFASYAFALVLEFDPVIQSGSHYEYSYSLTNDESFDVNALTIFFEADSYQNLQILGSPADWDPLVVDPDPFFGDGYADWATYTLPIASGETLSGFRVAFDWIGVGAGPFDSQYFEIYDPNTFDLLISGDTIRSSSPPVEVPEPSMLWLLLTGLAGIVFARSSSVARKAAQG